jgi:hypothetical protein
MALVLVVSEWEHGTHNRGGVRLDVLLADADDRTSVVGELKLPATWIVEVAAQGSYCTA